MQCSVAAYSGLVPIVDHEALERILFSEGATYLDTPYVGDAQGELYASPYTDKSLTKRATNFCAKARFCWYDHQVRALYANEEDSDEYLGRDSLRSSSRTGRTIRSGGGGGGNYYYYRLIDNLVDFLRLAADQRRQYMRSVSTVCLVGRVSNHPLRIVAGPRERKLFTVRSADREMVPGDVVGMYTGCVREEQYGADEDTSYSFGLSCYAPQNTPFQGYEPRIDALEFGNEMRYINSYNGYHYEDGTEVLDANVAGFQVWVFSEVQKRMVPAVVWIATRRIAPLTELLADYGPAYWYHRWKEATSRKRPPPPSYEPRAHKKQRLQ